MNWDNLPMIISLTIGFAAVVSPVLVAYINGFYDLKKYKLEVNQRNNYDLRLKTKEHFDDYCLQLGKLHILSSATIVNLDQVADYKKSFYHLLPYVDMETRILMIQLDTSIDIQAFGSINKLMIGIIDSYQLHQQPTNQ